MRLMARQQEAGCSVEKIGWSHGPAVRSSRSLAAGQLFLVDRGRRDEKNLNSRRRDRLAPRRVFDRAEAGFLSVSEVLLALGMGAIITFALTVLFVATARGTAAISVQAELQSNVTLAMNQILRDVQEALALENSRTVNGTPYPSTNTTLILRLPSISPATGQILDIKSTFDYVIYTFQQNGSVWELRRIVDANAASRRAGDNGIARTLSRSLTAVTFDRGSANAVMVELTGQRTGGDARQQMNLRSKAVLRNA